MNQHNIYWSSKAQEQPMQAQILGPFSCKRWIVSRISDLNILFLAGVTHWQSILCIYKYFLLYHELNLCTYGSGHGLRRKAVAALVSATTRKRCGKLSDELSATYANLLCVSINKFYWSKTNYLNIFLCCLREWFMGGTGQLTHRFGNDFWD